VFKRLTFACLLLAFFLPLLSAQQSGKQAPSTLAGNSSIAGTFADNFYRNAFLGFSCKVRYGWVDRTNENRSDAASPSNGQVLLAVFERPPEVKGEGVNSAVIFAAESLSAYPGVKTAADYFDPLSEATTSQGFKVVNEPYATTVGTKPLVRGDFSKEVGKLIMYQSSLVMLSKGYAISFTFIGSSEDEVEQLISQLSFAAPAAKH
jgi:hypothetical protein